jgi:hypothetical protein
LPEGISAITHQLKIKPPLEAIMLHGVSQDLEYEPELVSNCESEK